MFFLDSKNRVTTALARQLCISLMFWLSEWETRQARTGQIPSTSSTSLIRSDTKLTTNKVTVDEQVFKNYMRDKQDSDGLFDCDAA